MKIRSQRWLFDWTPMTAGFGRVARIVLPGVMSTMLGLSPFHAAQADEGRGIDFSGSGFLTVAAGKILKGSHDAGSDLDYRCPCFISDFANGGIYEHGAWQAGPDSKIGMQGSAAIEGGRYSLTGQVVVRGAGTGTAELGWLYGTANLSSKWTLQVGRKRLPLFNYSESQDVGFSYPWVHLPPQLYGWEIVNYNGANLQYRDVWGPWTVAANVFAGNEARDRNAYWKIYNGKHSRTDSRWSDIVGGDLKLGYDWFDVRLLHIQSNTQNKIVSEGETDFSPKRRQKISGLSFNVDYANWIGVSEFLYIDRKADYGQDYSQLYGIGYRMGRFLPFLSYANYRQQVLPELNLAAEAHNTWSMVLRYDLTNTSALKIELDRWKDRVKPGYSSMHGDAHLLTLSYDRVF